MLKQKCKDLLRSVSEGLDSLYNTAGVDTQKATEAVAEGLYKMATIPNFGQRVGTFVRASYLTSPGAHIMNTVSNIVQIGLQPILTALSGRPREALAMLDLQAIGEGFSLAASRFWGTMKSPMVDPSRMDFQGRIADNETFNKYLISPLTLTRAIDNASKAILETMTHQSLYHRVRKEIPEAYVNKNKLSEENLRKGIHDFLLGKESKDADLIKMLEGTVNIGKYRSYITNVGDYVTFNRQLGDSMLDRGAKALEGFRQKDPTGFSTLLFPFIKTPVNVAKEGAGYIPGVGYLREMRAKADANKIESEILKIKEGFKSADARQAALAENPDVLQQGALDAYRQRLTASLQAKEGELMMLKELPARYRAQQLIGAGLMTYAYGMFKSDQITGHFSDPNVRATREAQGIPPMSIKLGDRWYSYDKLEPLSTVLGMVADGFENGSAMMRRGDPLEIANTSQLIFKTVGENILNKTFTEQLGNMMMATQQPERYGNAFTQLLNPVVPSIIAQTAKFNDPVRRDISGETALEKVINPLKGRIPGLREELPARVDLLGNPAMAANTDSTTEKILDVFGGIKSKADQQTDEQSLITNPFLTLSPSSKKIQGLELSPKQYAALNKELGEVTKDIIADLYNDPDFKSLSKPYQAAIIKKQISKARKGVRKNYLGDMLEDEATYEKYLQKKLISKGMQEEE